MFGLSLKGLRHVIIDLRNGVRLLRKTHGHCHTWIVVKPTDPIGGLLSEDLWNRACIDCAEVDLRADRWVDEYNRRRDQERYAADLVEQKRRLLATGEAQPEQAGELSVAETTGGELSKAPAPGG